MIENQFIYPMRVQIEDTDYTGLVYHANYLNFMERARSEWIDELGLDQAWQQLHQLYFLLHSANIQFLYPARLHERLEVVTRIKTLRPASIIFDQYLRFAHTPDKIICRAEFKVVCVDYDIRPRPLPKTSIIETIWRSVS